MLLQEKAAETRAKQQRRDNLATRPVIDLPKMFDARRHEYDELTRRRLASERTESLKRFCNVPTRYSAATLEGDFTFGVPTDCRCQYNAAAKQLNSLKDKPGLVALIGARGPGKTWMGCGLVMDFCRAERSAIYLDVMDYFIGLKTTYDDKATKNESQYERDYLRPSLLVLDEVHERGDTAWEDRMLTRLINKRYAMELSTVLISNQTEDQFVARVGESIASRITDGGGVIVCGWRSIRAR